MKYLSVKIHPWLKKLLDKYNGSSEYLFPYLKETPSTKKEYIIEL